MIRYNRRVFITGLAVTALFTGLGVRLAFLHLKPAEKTITRLAGAHRLEQKTRGPRGRIFDRNGNMLAIDIAARHVAVDPKFILSLKDGGERIRQVCRILSEQLKLPRSEVWTKIDQPQRQYVPVKKFVREDALGPLLTNAPRGVIFEPVSIRDYPAGVLAAHVIGFANHEGTGSAGIEMKMNSYLTGSNGLRVSERDARRREIYSRRTVDIAPQPGADVYLTLDQQVQYFAEKALDELVAKYSPKGAWAIVQRVKTGEILAMASWPTFNLKRFNITPPEWMRNRAINYTYEPGSVMKALIIASAIDSGEICETDVFDCEGGRWVYGGRPLHDSHGYDDLSVAEILKKSSNIGVAKIALAMGGRRVYDSLKAFGFGSRTGFDLPGEDAGIVWSVDKWSKISITRLAMGHEVLVTSLQMLSALNAVANEGVRMKPYLVDRVVDANGNTLVVNGPEELGRPISRETAVKMRRLLARVTQPGGTGTKAALPGYLVAGKTGTAQKVNLEEGGYFQNKYIASFAGFLPVENPEVGIIVVVDDPQGAHYGGTVCAPAFKKIADQTVRCLRIPSEGFVTEYISDLGRVSGEVSP